MVWELQAKTGTRPEFLEIIVCSVVVTPWHVMLLWNRSLLCDWNRSVQCGCERLEIRDVLTLFNRDYEYLLFIHVKHGTICTCMRPMYIQAQRRLSCQRVAFDYVAVTVMLFMLFTNIVWPSSNILVAVWILWGLFEDKMPAAANFLHLRRNEVSR